MIKKYEARIISRDIEDTSLTKFESIDTIESSDLIHLLTQISFCLMRLQKKELEKKYDDDIPF